MMILDEALNIKSGKDSLVWRTLSGLNATSVIALTGTPIPNVPVDVIGMLDYQSTFNPYNLPEGHPNALLQCHVNAIHDWIKNEKDPRLQGERLKKLFRHCLLSRRYTTVVNGRVIGADLPPIKIETVVLRGTPAQDKQIGDIMKELKDRLLKAVKSGSSMAFVPKVVRTASQASFWFPFARMETWDGCKTIREIRKDLTGVPNAAQLKRVMMYIHKEDQTILGFDPTAFDGLDLVEKVIEQSPKMQWALHDATIMVLALQKKIVLWVNWPWAQLLTEVVLKACGFSASSYHAGLSRGDQVFSTPQTL
ncbi:putative dna repair helicase [Diplodia seriata]|uniref:Putative dna repair helicase n=1 Tax=Diplodia seriata TaxID=420778 RepID=A0A0G2EUN9_9PEZI|nr:putative dna repair helicase [Diplodia seriata]